MAPALGGQYRLSYVSGRWFDEWQHPREPLQAGVKALESRRMTTSHQSNPWFAVDRGSADRRRAKSGLACWPGAATGKCWRRLPIRLDPGEHRPQRLGFCLAAPARRNVHSPASLAGYTQGGLGAPVAHAARLSAFHSCRMARPHKVLYNSWEATTLMSTSIAGRLAEIAAQMGVELFVMDDGWFHGRDIDNAGLGDWWPDEKKFPNGLKPLIERVNDSAWIWPVGRT